mmetsp:Transcript_96934/g.278467  ORF Transcript_96934/g.278467 Transcript_96934/m.278467 type:complete len:273 (-) Transcript_96934:632-1450(-)
MSVQPIQRILQRRAPPRGLHDSLRTEAHLGELHRQGHSAPRNVRRRQRGGHGPGGGIGIQLQALREGRHEARRRLPLLVASFVIVLSVASRGAAARGGPWARREEWPVQIGGLVGGSADAVSEGLALYSQPVQEEVCSLFKEPRWPNAVVPALEDSENPLTRPSIVQILRVVRQHECVVGGHAEQRRAARQRRAVDGHELEGVKRRPGEDLGADHVEGPTQQEGWNGKPAPVHQLLGHGAEVPESGVQNAGREIGVLGRAQYGGRGAHGPAP